MCPLGKSSTTKLNLPDECFSLFINAENSKYHPYQWLDHDKQQAALDVGAVLC